MLLNGTHSIIEVLKQNSTGTLFIDSSHKSFKIIISLAKKNNCIINVVPNEQIKKLGGHQKVLFETTSLPSTRVPNLKQWLQENKTKDNLCIILLDHILDPQNFGAIVRSAVLLDVDLIILPEKRQAPENAIANRSSAGAMSHIARCYSNLSTALTLLQNNDIWVYSVDMDGTDITKVALPSRVAFILGAEHKGISPLLKSHSDEIISIPSNNKIDSYNVSVSAALVCFEYYKQQRK